MSLITGRRTWDDFRSSVKRSPGTDRHLRLDITFNGPEPGLDDVEVIPELKAMVRSNKHLSQAIDEISRRILASLFYFELEAIPKRNNAGVVGSGHILCLKKKSSPALDAIINKVTQLSAKFVVNGVEISSDIRDASFWDKDGNFCKRVLFKGPEIHILLKERGCQGYPISGAPFSAERLVAVQGLNADFGTADHKTRKRACSDEGDKMVKRRKIKSICY